MQAAPVDLVRGNDAHHDSLGAADDGAVEVVAPSDGTCFESFRIRERPDAVFAQARVVEQHSGDDERAGERAAAGLVRSRDEPRAELPVEPEQLLAGAAHAPTIARLAVGACDESVQFRHALEPGGTPGRPVRAGRRAEGEQHRVVVAGDSAATNRRLGDRDHRYGVGVRASPSRTNRTEPRRTR